MTEDKELHQVNEGTEDTIKVQVPVKIFKLNERKDAVKFALQTQGRLYIWGTDGNSDWLKRGDQTDYPYCLVVVDPSYTLPDYVNLVPMPAVFEEDYRDATDAELAEFEAMLD